jgi:phosphoglycerate dehydrogenase-like enzyme
MTVVLVGLGSIGARHAEVLRELGERVLTVSRRAGHGDYRTVTKPWGAIPKPCS